MGRSLPLKYVTTIRVNGWAAAAFAEEENWLLVRSAMKDAPVRIFSFQGKYFSIVKLIYCSWLIFMIS